MPHTKQYTFFSKLDIIGINPFVFVPEEILQELFIDANRNKGNIPIKVSVNGSEFIPQTLLRYQGEWRLYINTMILKDSPKRIAEELEVTILLDLESREIPMDPNFLLALENNQEAKKVYDSLISSLQKEINRYINNLKSENSKLKNIDKAIQFLLGQEKFIGRKL
ncbi:YdeI/OmpD-associated family protein [Sphingobacterium cellulitidis]|uniref:YdeI/OmpD-associated family protein n=1 Tax=Sphingobacterium cellulitidis TaxID=1768011 RepID=UPI00370D1C9D